MNRLPVTREFAERFAEEWIAAWNGHGALAKPFESMIVELEAHETQTVTDTFRLDGNPSRHPVPRCLVEAPHAAAIAAHHDQAVIAAIIRGVWLLGDAGVRRLES
jgi:hypothetical protein